MSTSSFTTKLVAPFSNPANVIRNRQRNRGEPSLLLDFEEINMDPNINQGPHPAGPNPQNPPPDLRTMEELCQPTMVGRGGPIAPMTMQATDFGLKNRMIQQVQQSCQYYGLPRDDANKHIDKFLTVTQNMKQNGVSHDVLRLCLFPYSLTHHVIAWNDISNFRQLLDESLFEAWEHYKLSVDQCPNHNMLPVTKIDTFYNGLTLRHQDTINAAAGDIFMKRRPEECYDLIENMTTHHNDWDTSAQGGESSRSITSSSPEITALTQHIVEMNKNFLRMSQSNQQVNVVNPSCETCGGPHHYSECQAAGGFTQGDVYAAIVNYNVGANQMTKIEKSINERPQGALPSKTIPNPQEDIKVITTRSGITLAGPSVPPPNPPSSNEVERDPKPTIDQMFKKLHFNIIFAEALAQMPKYANMLKDLLTNKEKLLELANTPLNENFSAVILKKLPEKLGDLRKFLIPCDFSELEECMALADLGASINLMPLSMWKKLMLHELIPTRMTLELANRSVAYPAGIAEDVFVQVGKFTFPTDFVVVDYDVDPRVPLILGRPFLRTACALVDVHREELILRAGDEKLTFNVDSTLKYSHKHGNDPTPSSDPIVASRSPSLTPFGDSDFLLEETNTFLALDSMPPDIDNGIYDSERDILFLEKLLEDEPLEAEKSEINPLIREPSNTFLMGDKEIKFNSLKDIDDPVPILRVSEKPLDSLDFISETFVMTITNPLFDFDYEFTLISDNPIFDIQNKDSDESNTETIIEDVQIHSSQSSAQIPPPYEELSFDMTMHDQILILSQFCYGIFGSNRVYETLGLEQFSRLSYYLGLLFPNGFSKSHSLDLFKLGDENEVFDPGTIAINGRLKSLNEISPEIELSLSFIL
ncbi:reverse transcriptase domain-containing protein [Tanacetum coccineum]